METQPKVSVIVPIYNVEKYLRQCLDSIVGQTLKDLEIILINDGSKDNSLAIITEYAKKDARIKIIDKPNEGYGMTMNRGFDAATGEYIGIVESDDWIESNMYEILYKIAKTCMVDVVKAGYIQFNDKTGGNKYRSLFSEQDVEQVINPREHPEVFTLVASIWSGIYRNSFLKENEIRFLESPGASYQDIAFNFKVWAMANSVYLTRKPLLHYRVGHTGQSVKSKDKVFCVCDEFKEIERYMADKEGLFHALEKIFNRVKYVSYIWNYNRLDGKNREEFRKVMAAEFLPILKERKMDMSGLTQRKLLKLHLILEPSSKLVLIKYNLIKLASCFIKVKYKYGVQTCYLLGFIPIFKHRFIWKGIKYKGGYVK